METIAIFFQVLFWVFLAATVLGMVKPWAVLWFLDFKNRLTVVKIYGSITVLLAIINLLLRHLIH